MKYWHIAKLTINLTTKIFISLLLAIIIFAHHVSAKDFGIEGHTFPIIEEDILKVIEKKLGNIDIDKFNKEIQNKTKEYIERPKAVFGIKKAKERKVSYFDPSYKVPENIYDHNNNLLHEADKIINPLEHTTLQHSMIFIDGDDEEQVKLALDIISKKQGKLKIVLVKGSPLKIQRKHKIWIYFDQAGFITNKFGIKEVPALVEQEGLKLKITIMGDRNA
jgi:conjugal transfer pilus assembly protein TraW